MNIPYKRETDENGRVTNLSKEQPFINNEPKQPNKKMMMYITLSNGLKVKNCGNNRKNSSKRKGKQSRLYQNLIK